MNTQINIVKLDQLNNEAHKRDIYELISEYVQRRLNGPDSLN